LIFILAIMERQKAVAWGIIHNSCLPGVGWGLIDAREVKVPNKNYPNGVEVNYILARKGDGCVIMLHWYQSAGSRVIATGIEQNIRRFLGRIFYNRNDGAFIRVSVFSGESGIEESNLLANSFAEKVLDLVPHYWPLEE